MPKLPTPNYKIVQYENDTFLYVILDKKDLHLLRTYITELEYSGNELVVLKQKNSLLEDKINLFDKEKINYGNQIEILNSSIEQQKKIAITIEEQHKKDLKKKWMAGFKTGCVTTSIIIGVGSFLWLTR